jgi:hypothetical protein
MVISCWICAVIISLRAFIPVRTPKMYVASLETYWVTEPMLSSMFLCFEWKVSRSRSISASRSLTVDRLEMSSDTATDCPPYREV